MTFFVLLFFLGHHYALYSKLNQYSSLFLGIDQTIDQSLNVSLQTEFFFWFKKRWAIGQIAAVFDLKSTLIQLFTTVHCSIILFGVTLGMGLSLLNLY